MVERSLIEEEPVFILDTHSLNRLPPLIARLFRCFCPEGVLLEHRKWLSLPEMFSSRMEEAQREYIALREELEKFKGFLLQPSPPEIREAVERAYIALRLEEMGEDLPAWDSFILREAGRLSDPFERARRDFYLSLAGALLASALVRRKKVVVKSEGGGEGLRKLREVLEAPEDLGFLSSILKRVSLPEPVFVAEEEGRIAVGEGEEEELQLLTFGRFRELEEEVESRRRRFEELRQGYEEFLRQQDEMRNAAAVLQVLSEQGRIEKAPRDELFNSLLSSTKLLSKSLARDIVKLHAEEIAAGAGRELGLVQKAQELLRGRASTKILNEKLEERIRGRLWGTVNQLLSRIEFVRGKKGKLSPDDIQTLADDFQREENLEVDVEIVRLGVQKALENPQEEVFLVSNDPDVIELQFLAKNFVKERENRDLENMKYTEVGFLITLFERLRNISRKLYRFWRAFEEYGGEDKL